MKYRNLLGLALVGLLFSTGYLLLPQRSQARPEGTLRGPNRPIVIWSGTLAEIPGGWQLCDGTNGTPDLRDRFVMGVRSGETPGGTGGAHEVQLTVDKIPAHDHSYQTDDDGYHVHTFNDTCYCPYLIDWGGIFYGNACNASYVYVTRSTSVAGDHSHSGNTDDAGTSLPFENRPASYRVAFITPVPGAGFRRLAVTKGTIMMWSGASSAIPGGWHLCDGTKGTPDLRDRFVFGVQQGQNPGDRVGSDSIQLTEVNLPAHRHSFLTDVTGAHSHTYSDAWADSEAIWAGFIPHDFLAWAGDAWDYELSTDSSPHTHTGVTDLAGGVVFLDNRPAYYSLAFIMRL